MKKLMTFLLAAVLLIGAAPVTQAQGNKTLTSKEADQLLQRIVGNWQVNQYDSDRGKFIETKGTANFSRDSKDNYVHEQLELLQPDGSAMQGDGFLRYSEEQNRFELVQLDKNGKSIVLMVGKWLPKYNTLAFTPVKGEKQWSSKIDPSMHCLYIFKHDGTFMKINRTIDKNGNLKATSQYHFSLPGVAKL
ncbi:DUF1579 domain-containing protein [Pontibacter diazotrophicus]|uniref:DUF1579 domain-containing protein n=1 Tax=Pontibacter diazotrophicus TaxID=1400979 RepID=A0A3D8LDD7_9BACT|nr:DUF1579 family protein [Pontibacter diazotrophicus]RDV15294.1 DUF1579 domain-containing protein [Pontibacter diazotrophicus]